MPCGSSITAAGDPLRTALTVTINSEAMPVNRRMRYLGLIIDSQWRFGPHFELLVPRVTTAANTLRGLLPNSGGAGSGVPRFYEGVVQSRVLYGAPVSAQDLMVNRRSRTLERRLQRTTAIRIARGYRTICYESATVLAASPPFELRALELRRVWENLRAPPSTTTSRPRTSGKRRSWRSVSDGAPSWGGEDARPPHRAVRAVLPNREACRDQCGVPLTFRTSQMLTGYGVFGEYLLKIGREVTSICHHCGKRRTRRSTFWSFVLRGRNRGASCSPTFARG
jgi:hypothetical protein